MLISLQLWILYNKLPTPTSSSAKRCQVLKKEIVQLKRELGNTSPQDNFSKWAKLDRQHNKAMAEYQKLGMSQLNIEAYSAFKLCILTDAPCSRWLFAFAPVGFHIDRLYPSLARNARPPLRPTVLVLQVADVLDTRGLGSILR